MLVPIVSVAGHFFLIRRVRRGKVLNSFLHGLFDFSLLTGSAIPVDKKAYLGSAAAILVYVIQVVVVPIRRRNNRARVEMSSERPCPNPAGIRAVGGFRSQNRDRTFTSGGPMRCDSPGWH